MQGTLTRDLKTAKTAYESNDGRLSIEAHHINSPKGMHVSTEAHQKEAGEHIKSVVFGGLDGIITTFAIITAASAAHLSRGVVLIIGAANLIGDAIGMAVGDYVSSKAEINLQKSERDRESWEIDNCLDEEKREMVDIYTEKGLSRADAEEVVELLLQHKETFLDVMMIEELGLMPLDKNASPLKGAIITFAAFTIFGGIPMLAYLIGGGYSKRSGWDDVMIASVILFAASLFLLGSLRGWITGKRWYLTGILMLLNGSVTTAIAYAIGYAFDKVANT